MKRVLLLRSHVGREERLVEQLLPVPDGPAVMNGLKCAEEVNEVLLPRELRIPKRPQDDIDDSRVTGVLPLKLSGIVLVGNEAADGTLHTLDSTVCTVAR